MYGFMETGYGYGGKESRIGFCIIVVLWRRVMDMVEKKADLDPVYMSHDMRFPTMQYVRPAKPQISLRIQAV